MGVSQRMTLNLFLEVKYQSGMSSDEAGSEAFGGDLSESLFRDSQCVRASAVQWLGLFPLRVIFRATLSQGSHWCHSRTKRSANLPPS